MNLPMDSSEVLKLSPGTLVIASWYEEGTRHAAAHILDQGEVILYQSTGVTNRVTLTAQRSELLDLKGRSYQIRMPSPKEQETALSIIAHVLNPSKPTKAPKALKPPKPPKPPKALKPPKEPKAPKPPKALKPPRASRQSKIPRTPQPLQPLKQGETLFKPGSAKNNLCELILNGTVTTVPDLLAAIKQAGKTIGLARHILNGIFDRGLASIKGDEIILATVPAPPPALPKSGNKKRSK